LSVAAAKSAGVSSVHASTAPRLVDAEDAPPASVAAACPPVGFPAEAAGAELPPHAVNPSAAVRTSQHHRRLVPTAGLTPQSVMPGKVAGLRRDGYLPGDVLSKADRLDSRRVGVSRVRPYVAHIVALGGGCDRKPQRGSAEHAVPRPPTQRHHARRRPYQEGCSQRAARREKLRTTAAPITAQTRNASSTARSSRPRSVVVIDPVPRDVRP
jgi:hypothetical protein